jgi:hypothetical protein
VATMMSWAASEPLNDSNINISQAKLFCAFSN